MVLADHDRRHQGLRARSAAERHRRQCVFGVDEPVTTGRSGTFARFGAQRSQSGQEPVPAWLQVFAAWIEDSALVQDELGYSVLG